MYVEDALDDAVTAERIHSLIHMYVCVCVYTYMHVYQCDKCVYACT